MEIVRCHLTNSHEIHGQLPSQSTREPLATLPPSSTYVSPRSNSLSRSSDAGSSYSNYRTARSTAAKISDQDFYEKYSPSRYQTKYELSRSRSLSETKPRDSVSPSKPAASTEVTFSLSFFLCLFFCCDFPGKFSSYHPFVAPIQLLFCSS